MRNIGKQKGPHLVKIWPKNAIFCILCMLKHESWWLKVIEDIIMLGKIIWYSGYLEMAKNGPKGPKISKKKKIKSILQPWIFYHANSNYFSLISFLLKNRNQVSSSTFKIYLSMVRCKLLFKDGMTVCFYFYSVLTFTY